MAEDLDGVVSNIRAVIVSSKFPVALRNLTRDYETMIGDQIPYRSFNYHNLESFLQSIPTLKITGSGRDLFVEAVKDEASSHISQMISKQKTTKKPPPHVKRGGYSQRGSYNRSSYVPRPSAPSRYSSHTSTAYQPTYQSAYQPSYQPSYQSAYQSAPKSAQQSAYQPAHQSAHQSTNQTYSRKTNSNNVEENTKLVVVASDGARQVSLENSYTAKHAHLQKQEKPSYTIPPRFRKNLRSSTTDTSSDHIDSINYITKDVEDTLFLEKPEPDPRLREIRTNIISALKPSHLVAVGRATQEVAQSQLDGLYLQGAAENLNKVLDPLVSQQEQPALTAQVPKPDDTNILNNMNLLLQYTSLKKWNVPDYYTICRKPKDRSPALYGATVKLKIGETILKSCTSYPIEDEKKSVAQGYAAKKALEELFEEERMKLEKPIISSDPNSINDRVSKIVAGHYNGIFANTVESLYSEEYKEQLPSDWLHTLKRCPHLTVEPTLANSIIIPKVPSTELGNIPEILVPPEENNWDVYVTSAISTCQVWLRLVSENVKYEKLCTNMEQFYKEDGLNLLALNIEEGHYYAAESNDGFHRVCVTAVNSETKTVNAFLIDHGDNDIFAFNNLYRLIVEFCTLPRQAIQCCLEGLENFSDDPFCSEILSSSEYLIGNTLVAEIKSRSDSTGLIKVTLFDTNGSDDINVNEKIMDLIISEFGSVPKLPEKGHLKEVYVSHISNRGEVYIQIPNDRLNQMAGLIQSLGPNEISKHKLTSYRQVKLNTIYLAKYSKDDQWYRAVITSTPSVQQNKIAIRFVDYGNSEIVSISDITSVEKLPLILSTLHPQAIKVALSNLPYETLNQSQIAYLNSYLQGEDNVVIIKLVNNQQDLPEVEIFYKKNDGTGSVVSVNVTLQDSTFDCQINGKAPISKLRPNEAVVSYLNLKKPTFDDYSFQEVELILTANPGNFVFYVKKDCEELNNLMVQLNDLYSTTDFPKLQENEIVIGGVYAAFYETEWLRVVVTAPIIDSKVPVRLIDFGDVTMLQVSVLRRIEAKYCEPPFMAIKGKLAGVAPIHTDWSVDDCIRFQKLVSNKQLAASVVSIDDTKENPLDMVVSLHLTDTLTEKNIVIAEVLCNEHRAVYVSST